MADGTSGFNNEHDQYSSFEEVYDSKARSVCSEIKRVANNSYFEECNVESFRKDFLKCLSNLVSLSRDRCQRHNDTKWKGFSEQNDSNTLLHYNIELLERCLFPGPKNYSLEGTCTSSHTGLIAWREMCQNYDDTFHHRLSVQSDSRENDSNCKGNEKENLISIHHRKVESRTTALEEVVSIISHPSTFPPCFAPIITMTLIRVFTEAFSDKNASFSLVEKSTTGIKNKIDGEMLPSATLLCSHLQSIILQRSNMSLLGKSFIRYIQQTIDFQYNKQTNQESYFNVEKLHNGPTRTFIEDNLNTTKVCNLLSLSSWLLKNESILSLLNHSCWIIVMLNAVIKLVAKLDQLDIELLRTNDEKNKRNKGNNIICQNCNDENLDEMLRKRKRRRKVQTSSLSDLHDTEIPYSHVNHSPNNGVNFVPAELERKIVPSQTYRDSELNEFLCDECFVVLSRLVDAGVAQPRQKILVQKRRASEITLLTYDMCRLRSILYQTILSICPKIMPHQLAYVLAVIPKTSHFHTSYPSLRFSTLLIIHSLGKDNGYSLFLKSLWEDFLRSSNDDTLIFSKSKLQHINNIVRTYSEIIIEVRAFDDVEACWKGLKPLLDHVLFLKNDDTVLQTGDFDAIDSSGRSSLNLVAASNFVNDVSVQTKTNQESELIKISCQNNQKHNTKFFIKITLRYIVHILARRRHCFANNSSQNQPVVTEFNEYIVKLSLSFEDVNTWVDQCSCVRERKTVISTLKALGILSFFDITPDESETENIVENDSQKYKNEKDDNWLFDRFSTLRSAIGRAGPNNLYVMILADDFTKLISQPRISSDNDSNNSFSKKNTTPMKQIDESQSIVNFIYDDTLRVIFSFLGYKLLSKASLVCREWNSVSREDLFWKEFYLKRFKSKFETDHIPNDIHSELRLSLINHYKIRRGQWRNIFDSKWKLEKRLRLRCSKSGWRHRRTCQFVGCFDILSTPEQIEKHKKEHEKNCLDLMKKMKLRMQQSLKNDYMIARKENETKRRAILGKVDEEKRQLEMIHNFERETLHRQEAAMIENAGCISKKTNPEFKRKVDLLERQIKNESLQLKRRHISEMKLLKKDNLKKLTMLSEEKRLLSTSRCYVLCQKQI